MVLEVMGRDAGHIAIAAGIAGGADVVLIPEVPWRLERVVEHIARLRAAGRSSALVVVAEAARQPIDALDPPQHGVGDWLAHPLTPQTGPDPRPTLPRHLPPPPIPTPPAPP